MHLFRNYLYIIFMIPYTCSISIFISFKEVNTLLSFRFPMEKQFRKENDSQNCKLL